MFPIHGFDFGPRVVTSWGDDMSLVSGTKGSGWDSHLTHTSGERHVSQSRRKSSLGSAPVAAIVASSSARRCSIC